MRCRMQQYVTMATSPNFLSTDATHIPAAGPESREATLSLTPPYISALTTMRLQKHLGFLLLAWVRCLSYHVPGLLFTRRGRRPPAIRFGRMTGAGSAWVSKQATM